MQTAHDRLVRTVADRYLRQNYAVQINPAATDLPDFLRSYQPDMIVTTPDGKIVVDVKSKSKIRRIDYWESLRKAIADHPGWQFRFAVDNRQEEEIFSAEQPVLTHEEIQQRLETAEHLGNAGLLDSAILVTWSALEAALRETSRAQGLNLPNQGPGPLITSLYSEGTLNRPDYEFLMGLLDSRNQAAHGFQVQDIDRPSIDQARDFTKRLLADLSRAL